MPLSNRFAFVIQWPPFLYTVSYIKYGDWIEDFPFHGSPWCANFAFEHFQAVSESVGRYFSGFQVYFFFKVSNRTIDKILFWKWQASPFCNRYSKVVVFLFLLLLLLLLFLLFSSFSFLPHLLPSSSSSSFSFPVFVLNGYLIFFAICYIYIFENSHSLAWLKAGMLLMETPGILLWLFFSI